MAAVSAGLKLSAAPFMQYRWPSGGGPSLNTWPRWPSQVAQRTSARGRKGSVKSATSRTASAATGARKDGQPVPESNFLSLENSGAPQPAHTKVPARFSALSGEEKGASVAACRSTR